MKVYELEILLEKYYNGDTSLEEEQQLFRYFNQQIVPPAYLREKQWFLNLKEARQMDVSPLFENRVEEKMGKRNQGPALYNFTSLLSRPYKFAAFVILAVGLGFSAYMLYFSKTGFWNKVTTTTGQIRQVMLPDGTSIWLNGGSELRYPEKFTDAAREVWLEGEAYFEVKPDLQKPFLVHTEKSLTQVLGTSFNIRSYEEDSTIKVTVVSGKVAFSPASEKHAGKKVLLQKGNQGTLSKNTYSIQKSPITDPNILAWKTRELVFEDVPLQKVLPVLEKYFTISIKTTHPQLLQCRFRGTFRQATLEEILQVMEYSLSIRANRQGNTYILTGKGCQEN